MQDYTESTVPDKPTVDGLESKWSRIWEEAGTYRYIDGAGRAGAFAIDAPPPTVSGSLHVGHVFSYTHTDIIARYQRMCGKRVFYPMGWDDNGLPTERRVENYFGVVCDPTKPYQQNYAPPAQPAAKRGQYDRISRRNFVELCLKLTHIDEAAFHDLLVRLGLSIDWNLTYNTIGPRAQRISQKAFLRNLRRGEAYMQDAPSLWDATFQTAVAQAELEDRETAGAFYKITFHAANGDLVAVDTTRPELLPSCVALVAHPDDVRYAGLFGCSVHSPVFGVEVPVLAHKLAVPDKGTGIAMVCTFGDVTDVIWWRELDLPSRSLMNKDGTFQKEAPEWIRAAGSAEAYAKMAGRSPNQARSVIEELLKTSSELLGEPRPITHAVKFYEKGERPLEIISTRQWYIRNGGRDTDLRAELLERGREIDWKPTHMQSRFEHWVNGLNGDWLISRQRIFGVPIPVWYPLDAEGQPDFEHPLVPDESELPIDPSSHSPRGYTESARGQPGGFIGDPDVMDTWATSSLTPQIASGWDEDGSRFDSLFPFDIRPQGHDIIRTWLFGTLVRAHLEEGKLPWRHALISGWILDPDRKKMSKSKGNVITPAKLLDDHGSDGVRYWAAMGRPGADTAFEERQMKIGRRLATKVLNVAKLSAGLVPTRPAALEGVDSQMLAKQSRVLAQATAALEEFEYSRALESLESFFWWFCDDYVELVKTRAYTEGAGSASARHAIATAIDRLLRAFAPFMPFVTEEAWSWAHSDSIHLSAWPAGDARESANATTHLDFACDVLRQVRKFKSERQVSMKTKVGNLHIEDAPSRLDLLSVVEQDLRAAGGVEGPIATSQADSLSVTLTLIDEDQASGNH
ncbi:valine--tRNA ligase [Ideonella sp. 4Y16]|uniref:valine--tRNA ligase n=1 Tax=Ideonella alba TaxID=2824118 RepID=A0A941BE32_9BURK|nr:valine--tRNA ligase [Ideonella alba]MBQ0933645.1 valine--tRNA ligase [Ideonella alba]MBQ0946604.1 valine--tRNA ligase [Ideonella alba]